MSRVVRFEHAGVDCALPAHQVASVAREGEHSLPPISLWGSASAVDSRSLHVRTAAGERSLPCAEPRFEWVDAEEIVALPELLRDVLRLAHLVGVKEAGGKAIWFLDLARWEDG